MRHIFHKVIPSHETIKSQRWLKPFGNWLHHPNLWHLNRRSVAGGVSIGLFCGLIPGPLQMLSSAIFAIIFRVNLPVAAFTTLYTNPFTILPLYVVAYEIGAWVSGVQNGLSVERLAFPELHWDSWAGDLWTWFQMLGKPLMIGLPILATALAIAGYVAIRLVWRFYVVMKWRSRSGKPGF